MVRMNFTSGLRNLSRAREIVSVLVFGYGFGYVFEQLGLTRLLPSARRRRPAAEYSDAPGPRQLRLALAELGPAFIKLGQLLGARGDMLPPPVVAELRRLQDEGPVVAFEDIRAVVERELERPVTTCFREFSTRPLSSASLGQVHAAVTQEGREVIVKVLRPGVRRVVESDMQILSDLAALISSQVRSARPYRLQTFVRRFAAQLEDEMCFTIEARQADRIRRNLAEFGSAVRVPEVVWELSAREVLTTARVHGRRVDAPWPPGEAAPRREAAAQLAQALLYQVFIDGCFHGDPHHGNVLLCEDGSIALLDFGIIGYLDPRTRRLLGEAVACIYSQDVDGLVSAFSELGAFTAETDLPALRSELSQISGRFLSLPRREFPMGEVLMRTLRAMWLNHVRIPPELSLAAKALLLAESVAHDLDPAFDLREATAPVLEAARRQEMTPSALVDRAARAAGAVAQHLERLPERANRILTLLEQGDLRLRVEETEVDLSWGRLGRVMNRIGISMLAVGLLISGSILLVSPRHPTYVGLGTAAIAGATMLGLLVLLRAMRPGQL